MPPFLSIAEHTFQLLTDQVLRRLPYCCVHINDIHVLGKSKEEHAEQLREVFARLDDFGIVFNPVKCLFAVSELDLFGHHVYRSGIRPLP